MSEAARPPVLSVVIPCFNEGPNVEMLFDRLIPVLDGLGVTWEAVCVDDGSRDDTCAKLVAAHRKDSRVKVIELSRNFGKELALSAGLLHAGGDAVLPMDADLQHPPEVIPTMLAKWREGHDVVYAVRDNRAGQGLPQRAFAKAFYWVFQHLSDIPLPAEAGDFRLLDRKVVDVINRMPERSRFMKGIFAWVGFKQVGIPYPQGTRLAGTSKFNFFKLLRFAFDGLSAFSNFPLMVWSIVGAIVSAFAFLYIVFRLLRTAIFGVDVPGYESIIVTILFLGGVQLLSLGILGDYLGRVFDEVKRRPLYIVRSAHGFAESPGATDPRPSGFSAPTPPPTPPPPPAN